MRKVTALHLSYKIPIVVSGYICPYESEVRQEPQVSNIKLKLDDRRMLTVKLVAHYVGPSCCLRE